MSPNLNVTCYKKGSTQREEVKNACMKRFCMRSPSVEFWTRFSAFPVVFDSKKEEKYVFRIFVVYFHFLHDIFDRFSLKKGAKQCMRKEIT